MIERTIKYPKSISPGLASRSGGDIEVSHLRQRLIAVGRIWSDALHQESRLTNTHDLGFIILPHMRLRWELFNDSTALDTILTAAESLYTRFSPTVGAIRSWDEDIWRLVAPESFIRKENFIVIIDSMCNVDLLFYAASQSGHSYLAEAAVTHALTVLKTHFRQEKHQQGGKGFAGSLYSTTHVVNFEPSSGNIQDRQTAQGYSTTSTWSRGQAWAILGFTQTYKWTGDTLFLDVACGLVEYFLMRLDTADPLVEEKAKIDVEGSMCRVGRYVPLWDFDAPIENGKPLRDTSAGMVAANGMLMLSQILAGLGKHVLSARYLDAAVRIVEETMEFSLSRKKARLAFVGCSEVGSGMALSGVDVDEEEDEEDGLECGRFDAILRNATVANSPVGKMRIADHGLIYADYFLIEFGNGLLRMGLA